MNFRMNGATQAEIMKRFGPTATKLYDMNMITTNVIQTAPPGATTDDIIAEAKWRIDAHEAAKSSSWMLWVAAAGAAYLALK